MRSSEGSIKPMLPMISVKPINLTGSELTSFVHGISAYKFSIGKNNFPAPVMKNTTAKKICAVQRAVFRVLDGF
jgi:hypothetical protein